MGITKQDSYTKLTTSFTNFNKNNTFKNALHIEMSILVILEKHAIVKRLRIYHFIYCRFKKRKTIHLNLNYVLKVITSKGDYYSPYVDSCMCIHRQ